jgi:S-DNA-T family DNA segregation ATPase FtsK/SpoIIIE
MAKKKAKRGPGRPPKNSRLAKPKHAVPDGFWPQVGALFLIVFGLILLLGLFRFGGAFPVAVAEGARWLVGWTAFMMPLLFVWQAIQIYRSEDNRLPSIVWFATVLFLTLLAGLFQLMLNDPHSQVEALLGRGGGAIGWLVDQALLNYVSVSVAALILAVLIMVLLLFVLAISPKSVFAAIAGFFRRDGAETNASNEKVARQAAAADDKPKKVGEVKLNEGVPTVHTSDSDDPQHKSLKNATPPNRVAEDQAALTTVADPDWELPSVDLLEKKQRPADAGDVQHNADVIRETLSEFNINVEMEDANIGPKVTQYTLRPPSGVKLARITALETNIALNLAAQSLRMEAPIPGKKAVGIEVPNVKAADVRLYGIMQSKQWKQASEPLSFAIGRYISGTAIIGELSGMPHVLIAGQTGSGKSVMINSLICSMLYRMSPGEMKLILVDPKQVEMALYNDIPHLLTPVITDPKECISALTWAVNEMERRYKLLAEEKVRNIKLYNQKRPEEKMPYIVIVIDELADLMMMAARDVEALIVRLAQKARAVGVHLVLATQRPSVDVITGLIKANVPARIAFTVASQVDSRTILDQIGAEKLLGQGDMLLQTPDMSKPKRIQGALVSDDEVTKITHFLRLQRPPDYDPEIIAQPVQMSGKGSVVMDVAGGDGDEYRDAVRVVIEAGKASTSLLQRRLRIGYGKAARIMEEMEENGVIGAADGSRPREVLLSSLDELGTGE